MRGQVTLVLVCLLGLAGGAWADTPSATHLMPVPATVADWAQGARLFEGLGNFHRAIATDCQLRCHPLPSLRTSDFGA